jgi:hypothetical protein
VGRRVRRPPGLELHAVRRRERTGEEPLVVSEFGNWGLPDIAEMAGPDGVDPWWAAPGRDWAFGAAEATDTVGRFYKHRLDQVFGSWQGFVEATQRQQLLGTRYQIGSLRRRPQIAGYVLTQLSDVQWEANGLFDMDRRPRMFVDALALINGPATVVVRPATYHAVAGTSLTVSLDVVAPAGHADLGDRWELQVVLDDGTPQVLSVPAGVRSSHELQVALPTTASASSVRAELHVDGQLVGRDIAEVLVLPTPTPRSEPVRTTDVELAYWLQSIGVPVTDGEGPSLLVTRQFDTAAQAFARSGGRVLVVAEDKDALGDAFEGPLLARLVPRDGDGDWVPRFDWLRRDGAFAALPGGPDARPRVRGRHRRPAHRRAARAAAAGPAALGGVRRLAAAPREHHRHRAVERRRGHHHHLQAAHRGAPGGLGAHARDAGLRAGVARPAQEPAALAGGGLRASGAVASRPCCA